MQNQNRKTFRWILAGGLLTVILVIPEALIAKLISNNNPEVLNMYFMTMVFITMFIYLIISTIYVVKYIKCVQKHEQEELKRTRKELTKQFKPVLLNYSEPISKNLFECQAKVDDDGKIVCKIQLDYEVKIENYEEFLRFFHFKQN